MPQTAAEYETTLNTLFGAVLAPQLLELYPLSAYESPRAALATLFSDEIMHCPTRRAAKAMATSHTEPVWRYVFARLLDSPLLAKNGAGHGYDVPFVFHKFPWVPPTTAELAFSEKVAGYVGRFAATGDPNGSADFTWPKWDETEPHLVIDEPFVVDHEFHADKCAFWDPLE
jgi:para-nitrobenzyl esterase